MEISFASQNRFLSLLQKASDHLLGIDRLEFRDVGKELIARHSGVDELEQEVGDLQDQIGKLQKDYDQAMDDSAEWEERCSDRDEKIEQLTEAVECLTGTERRPLIKNKRTKK